LFAPPGQSPVRQTPVIGFSRPLSKGKDHKTPGKLARLNISNTGVTAEALLNAIKLVGSGGTVRLEQLKMMGSGATWNDALLKDFAQIMNVPKLQVLDISCSLVAHRTTTEEGATCSCLTDEGIKALLDQATNLKELHLMGHASLTLGTLARQATTSSALNGLQTLNLDGCTGISTKSSNPVVDLRRIDALAKALGSLTTVAESTTAKAKPWGSLRRLSLAHCFSNQEQLQDNPDLLAHEECLGQELVKALTNGTKRKKKSSASSPWAISSLRELDLRGCWFLKNKDVDEIRQHCPGIETIHLQGTRAADCS
jgi:hypothetical protein